MTSDHIFPLFNTFLPVARTSLRVSKSLQCLGGPKGSGLPPNPDFTSWESFLTWTPATPASWLFLGPALCSPTSEPLYFPAFCQACLSLWAACWLSHSLLASAWMRGLAYHPTPLLISLCFIFLQNPCHPVAWCLLIYFPFSFTGMRARGGKHCLWYRVVSQRWARWLVQCAFGA